MLFVNNVIALASRCHITLSFCYGLCELSCRIDQNKGGSLEYCFQMYHKDVIGDVNQKYLGPILSSIFHDHGESARMFCKKTFGNSREPEINH